MPTLFTYYGDGGWESITVDQFNNGAVKLRDVVYKGVELGSVLWAIPTMLRLPRFCKGRMDKLQYSRDGEFSYRLIHQNSNETLDIICTIEPYGQEIRVVVKDKWLTRLAKGWRGRLGAQSTIEDESSDFHYFAMRRGGRSSDWSRRPSSRPWPSKWHTSKRWSQQRTKSRSSTSQTLSRQSTCCK